MSYTYNRVILHAGLEARTKNPGSRGAELEPGPHPKKSGFNPGLVLHFTHPVRSRATPKPGLDPGFAKPIEAYVGWRNL